MGTPDRYIDLIRHTESVHERVVDRVSQLALEATLTPNGVEHAIKLGKIYRPAIKSGFALYASPARRAMMTARLAFPDQTIIEDNSLVELQRGVYAGVKKDIDSPIYQEYSQAKRDLGYSFRPPGGDSHNDVADRLTSWIKHVDQRHDPDNLIVGVGHSLAIGSLAARYGEIAFEDLRTKQDIFHGSITRMILSNGELELVFAGLSAQTVRRKHSLAA